MHAVEIHREKEERKRKKEVGGKSEEYGQKEELLKWRYGKKDGERYRERIVNGRMNKGR